MDRIEFPWTKLLSLALGLLFLIQVVVSFDRFQIGTWNDDAHYIVLARSLVMGSHFSYPNFPATTSYLPRFPIGFPLVIAPIIALLPQALWPLKLVALAATLLNGLLLFHFWPRWTKSSQLWGVIIAGVYWLNPLVLEHAHMVMSEALFMTIYLLLVAVVAENQSSNRLWWHWPAIGLLAIALIATRAIGAAIVAGVILSFLLKGNPFQSWSRFAKMILLAVTSTLLLGLLMLSSNAIFPQRYWGESIANLTQVELPDYDVAAVSEAQIETGKRGVDLTALTNVTNGLIHGFYRSLPDVVLSGMAAQAQRIDQQLPMRLTQTALAISIFTLVLLGGLRWIWSTGWHVLWLSGLFYAMALVFWIWHQVRLYYAIVPHILYAFLLGCAAIMHLVMTRRGGFEGKRQTSFLFLAFVAVLLLASSVVNLRRSSSTTHAGDLARRTTWLKENATADQIVMTELPFTDYLYGNTKTMYWPRAESKSELWNHVRDYNVDYLLMAPELEWDTPEYVPDWSQHLEEVQPLVEKLESQGQIVLVFTDDADNVRVYQVVK